MLDAKQILGIFQENYLINGGFDFIQRLSGTSGTYSATGAVSLTDKYGHDRWKISVGNAPANACSVSRIDTPTTTEDGLNARFYGAVRPTGSDGKFAIAQILEGASTALLRGRQVTFQVKLKANVAKTIKIALLQSISPQAFDSVTTGILNASNADSTDPNFGGNLSRINVDTVVNCTNTVTAGSCSVTTAWQNFAITCTVPAGTSCRNLICVIFPDAGFTVATPDTLFIAEAGLYCALSVQNWLPRPIQQELDLCKRYCQVVGGSLAGDRTCMLQASSGTTGYGAFIFEKEMRAIPTAVVANQANFVVYNAAGAQQAITGVTVGTMSTRALQINFTGAPAASLVAGNACMFSSNNVNATITMEAEL